MKNIFLLNMVLLVVFFFGAQYGIAQTSCANSANIYRFDYNGHSYEVVKENKSWTAAVACAVQRGGYLAEINDAAENTAIFNALMSASAGINTSLTSTSNGGGAAYVWIGGNDIATEGTWIWNGDNTGTSTQFWMGTKTGSATNSAYTNWGTTNGTQNEPDNYNSNQDGLAIALNAWPTFQQPGQGLGVAGQWNDIRDIETLFYIIEHSSILSQDTVEQIGHHIFVHNKQLYVELPGNSVAHINLYDLTAKKVLAVSTKPVPDLIDISALVPGVYLVEVLTQNGNSRIQKVII